MRLNGFFPPTTANFNFNCSILLRQLEADLM